MRRTDSYLLSSAVQSVANLAAQAGARMLPKIVHGLNAVCSIGDSHGPVDKRAKQRYRPTMHYCGVILRLCHRTALGALVRRAVSRGAASRGVRRRYGTGE